MHDFSVQCEIKNYLRRNGFRQKFVADGTEISESSLSSKLSGRVSMTVDELIEISDLLHATPNDLLGIKEE